MSSKIAKTLARQKEKVSEGQYYEAHQQLRVITARYIKAADWTSATSVLHNGALLLLRAGQGGSGGDLARMLIHDVYEKGELPVNKENRDVVVEILKAFPANEPTRKRYIGEMLGWSAKFGENERGDAEIHHAIGSLFAEEFEPYEAERHLLLGTSSSANILSTLHYKWYSRDSPHTAGLYASRSTLPYLLIGKLSFATDALNTFTSLLTTSQPQLPTQTIESSKSSVRIYPSLPLLNFLSLLLLACQKADAALYKQLNRHYASHLHETEIDDQWTEILAHIGEIWFGIRIPRQSNSNPLFDMMGSLFGGGGPAGGSAGAGAGAGAGSNRGIQGSKPGSKPATSSDGGGGGPPVAMDLD